MNISEEIIKEIISKVICNLQASNSDTDGFEKTKDSSGVMCIKSDTVKPELFDTGTPGNRVYLKDIVSLEESPRLGAGIMEMDRSAFDWELKYDEFDYIIEGKLEIIINGNKVVGNKGDIIFIPKGSKIQFSCPKFARFAYFTYPADWQNQ